MVEMAGRAALFALIVCLGCGADRAGQGGQQVPEGYLARVGEEGIDERDLREFEAAIQMPHRSKKEGLEAHREHLLSLIDARLMVVEAEARGLQRLPAFRQAMEWVEEKAMVEAYLQRAVGRDVVVTEEELRANFEAHPARYAVRGAHILLASRQEADQAYAEIASGRSFEEVARERSLDRETAEKGGAFDQYYAFDRVSDQIYEKVFKQMEVGQISEPMRTAQGWEIIKVVDRKEVDYEQYRPVVQRATVMQKLDQLQKEHARALQDRRNLRINNNNLTIFLEAWNKEPGRPALEAMQLADPLYTFEGGQLSLEEAQYALVNTGMGQARLDSARLDEHLRRRILGDLVLAAQAREQGFGEDPEVRRRVRRERDKRLLEALWEDVLEEELEVGEEEVRAHYENYPERYRAPAETVVQEILVAERGRAEELLVEVRGGADMGQLATRYSLRRYARENGGLYGMRPFERLIYKELMDAAQEAPVGQVQGPVEIERPLLSTLENREKLERAYSIFRVLERLPERQRTFEESRRLATFYARQEKQQQKLQELNQSLRSKYYDSWGLDERALRGYAEALSGS